MDWTNGGGEYTEDVGGLAAALRAAKLLVEHGGGEVLDHFTCTGSVPPNHKINMRSGLVAQILGAPVEQSETIAILEDSGVGVTALGDSLTLEIPSWRNDLRDPYDVIEEVGRHYGYDRIGLSLPVPSAGRGLTRTQRDRRNVVRAVAGLGFTELLTLPFSSDAELDQLGLADDDPRRAKVRLSNPLSETHPYLRTSLLPGLFGAIAKNKIRAARSLGASSFQVFRYVALPATVPYILTGMRLAMANSFVTIVAAEMVAANEGLGKMLWDSRLYMLVDDIFVALVSLGLLGFVIDRLFRWAIFAFAGRYSPVA